MRSFNYTGRKRISREHYNLSVSTSDGLASFDVNKLSLSSLGFPDNARIIIEAYHQLRAARFDFGTIAEQRDPDRSLGIFPDLSLVRFRIKVIDPATGRILGWADKIRPDRIDNNHGDYEPLLPVRSMDLDGEIWRINFDEELPVLELEKRLGDKHAFLADARNSALILPEALRGILLRILVIEKIWDTDGEYWQNKWLKFACSLNGLAAPRYSESNIDEIDEWVGDCVSRFARKHLMRQNFLALDEDGS
ncbi:hypothetical protein D6779_04285 [Candidatus Parcubacteria bacterium]|nr:MAG: hypothetical protein D6779_04285 [Candidatus Parcubacteria bacterium]